LTRLLYPLHPFVNQPVWAAQTAEGAGASEGGDGGGPGAGSERDVVSEPAGKSPRLDDFP
jgi:hypothetical protein